MSGEGLATAVDLRALTDGGAAAQSGVPHGELLLRFAEAAVETGPGAAGGCRGDPALVEARERILEVMGPAALVDAAAVVANFERMVRIADATGIPLDAPLDWATADVRRELGLERFAAAAHSPRAGPLKRAVAGGLRRALALGLRLGCGRPSSA